MDDVAMTTAARRLGLEPGEMWLAVQLGEVRSVRAPDGTRTAGPVADPGRTGAAVGGGPAGRTGGWPQRRVPRAELARLREESDFPDGLRERLRTVHAGGGAQLLGISESRFARLARAGFFSAVRCHVNRYHTVVWRYRAEELRQFAEQHPELLSGPLPRGLREVLAEGVDLRAAHWRGRRVAQLCRQAESPWESAAARAAVLPREALAEAVPHPEVRARLEALRPELTLYRGRTEAVGVRLRRLATAEGEDELFRYRLTLAADLEEARAAEPLGGEQTPNPQAPGVSAGALTAARVPGVRMPAARMHGVRTPGVREFADSRAVSGTSGLGLRVVAVAGSGDRGGAGAASPAGRSRQRAAAKRARTLLGTRASRQRPVWRRLAQGGKPGRPEPGSRAHGRAETGPTGVEPTRVEPTRAEPAEPEPPEVTRGVSRPAS
jgi:hypothetical protein